MKSNKFEDYWAIRAFIDSVAETESEERRATEIQECCTLLDNFWKQHCELTKTVLWFITYTVHDHGAKGMWAEADYLVRQLIKGSTYL